MRCPGEDHRILLHGIVAISTFPRTLLDGGLAELVDALDSKSSSNECGFESHDRYSYSIRV